MSLDVPRLEAAIQGDGAAAVRDELREATEAERMTARKALRKLFTPPAWDDLPVLVLRPANLAGLVSSGFHVPPASGGERAKRERGERERADQERKYEEWREIANGLAFHLAALGLAGGVAAAARAAQEFPSFARTSDSEIDLAAAVLADRAPGWLADFTDRHLRLQGQYMLGIPAWPLARKLVRLGAIARPAVPEYTILLPRGLRCGSFNADGSPTPMLTPAQALLADPGLLEDEVWRLFTVPDAGLVLEQADRRADRIGDTDWVPEQTWTEGLAQLCAQGHLGRGRLLDACLDAFCRDFAPYRVSWYGAMHRQLNPSIAEMEARAGKYLGLVAVAAKAGITVGQQGIRLLLDAGLLDVGRLLDASGPALLFPQKSVALTQLKLIGRVITVAPAAHSRAVGVAALAFGHERQDIQEAALALIRKHGIPDGAPVAEMRAHAADLAPSLAAQAAALGLGPEPCPARPQVSPASVQAPAPSCTTEGIAAQLAGLQDRVAGLPAPLAPDLAEAVVIVADGGVPGPTQVKPAAGTALPAPVTDPDELVQLLTVLLEDARDAMAVERALAGAVRLSSLPLRQRRQAAAPLLKRAAAVMDTYVPFSGIRITSDMALITHVWGGGELPTEDTPRHKRWHMPGEYAVDSMGRALTMAGIFSARAWEAARIIEAGQGGFLLAEPQTRRGAITLDGMVDTLQQLSHHQQRTGVRQAGRCDRDAAVLRLAPGTVPGSLWAAWEEVDGTTAASLRASHRLLQLPLRFEAVTGQPAGRPLRGQTWHQHLLARVTGRVPVVPRCTSWQLLTGLDDPLRDHAVLAGPSRYERHHDAAVAGWALICPWQPELAAAHLLRPLCDGLKPGPSAAATAITSLAHPGHPLGPVGHLALVAGLASAEADTRIAAAQLWADASADGRLDPALAAAAIVTGVTGQAVKLNRITDSLKAASHSPLAARRTVETVCASLPGLAPSPPASMHELVELTARLAATVGTPALPSQLTELTGRRSRLGVTAVQLQQAQHTQPPDRQRAALDALTALIGRAEAC